MKPYRVVFVTASNSKEAKKIAQSLLKNKLAACINILPSIQSSYWWKNKIETASETMLIIKTTQKKMEQLTAHIQKIHSYSVPEIIALPIIQGNKNYFKWMDQSL